VWLGSRRRKVDRTYLGLRDLALGLTWEKLGEEQRGEVVALLMETGYLEAVATLVGVADGSTSLYFSNGGGIIGGGQHEQVAAVTRRWLEVASSDLEQLTPVDEVPLPETGETQFVAVTGAGRLIGGASEELLASERHPLSPLFYAGQDVITQVRLVEDASA
jgi:hypothetical protein